MNFEIQRSGLSDELGRLSNIVDRKSPIPILENVLIRSNDGVKLSLACTNMNSSITSEALADKVTEPGALCVSVRKLYDIVNLLPEGLIHFKKEANGYVRVTAPGSNFRIPGTLPESFPPTDVPADLTWVEIPTRYLKSLLAGVKFAMAGDEDNRYTMKGAKLEIDGINVRMVTTDGHRVSLASGPLTVMAMEDIDVLVPEQCVLELARLVADADLLMVAKTENKLYFRAGPRVLASRLLTGKFPAYQEMFSNYTYDQFATFRADVLDKSIKRTLLIADTDYSVHLEFKNGTLFLDAAAQETGEAKEELPSNFNGPPTVVHINAKYISDFLDVLGTEDARLEVGGAGRPLRLKGSKNGVSYDYIVMPMNVPG